MSGLKFKVTSAIFPPYRDDLPDQDMGNLFSSVRFVVEFKVHNFVSNEKITLYTLQSQYIAISYIAES